MTAPEIKYNVGLSLDNTGQHADRGAKLRHTYWSTPTALPMHFAEYFGVVGPGDNTTYKGVGGVYGIAADPASMTVDQKGCLYTMALACYPRFDRNNTPWDDATCLLLQNDGPAKATEILYFGEGAYNLDPCAVAAIGFELNVEVVMWFVGHAEYALDLSRGLASPAVIDEAVIRIPPATVGAVARNAANTTDLELWGVKDDLPTLAALKVRKPVNYTPTVAAQTGELGAGATGVPGHSSWSQINGRVHVDACAYVGTSPTGSGAFLIGLPKPALHRAALNGHDTASGWGVYGEILPGESVARCRYIHSASPITNGNYVFVSGSYRPEVD